jgi:hypothetical protein
VRGRDRRRQIRRALEDEARVYWQNPSPLAFWYAVFELADGASYRLDGDALDRAMTYRAALAFHERRMARLDEDDES